MQREPIESVIRDLRLKARQSGAPIGALLELGRVCLAHHRLDIALEAFREAIVRAPNSAVLRFNFGWFAKQAGRAALALDQYAAALALGIDRPEEVHLNRANIFSELCADPGAARRELQQALDLNPTYLPAWLNLGNLAEQEGDRESAQLAFRRCLELAPRHPTALARLADTMSFEGVDAAADDVLQRLESVNAVTPDPDLAFALGRVAEQRGDSELAWRCYAQGNALDRDRGLIYDAESVERMVDALIARSTSEWMSRHATTQPFEPVFICGSFRSGSTLLEQMLAAHPSFSPAGERDFFPRLIAQEFPNYPHGIEQLNRSTLESWAAAYRQDWNRRANSGVRMTDKRPDNLFYLGLIKAIFPRARILLTRRDWRDVASSLFSTRLGPVAAYATDLLSIRRHLSIEEKLGAHWMRLFGPDLQIVDYEQLVTNPRETLGAVLDGLGECWDEHCLEFHGLTNPVRTASVWQVRAPLHASSIGRWRRFDAAFVEVFGRSVRD